MFFYFNFGLNEMFSDKILNRSLSESCLNNSYTTPVFRSVYVEEVVPVSSEQNNYCGTQLRRRYFSTTYIGNSVVPTQHGGWQTLTGPFQPETPDYTNDLQLAQDDKTVIESSKSAENNQDIPMDIDDNVEYSTQPICDTQPPNTIANDKCLKNGQLLNMNKHLIVKKSSKNTCGNSVKYAVLLFLTMLCFWNFIDMILCINQDTAIENLQVELSKSIYLQEAAVKEIKSNLNITRWSNKLKILAFFGPSGVGKTFTANIIKQHFGNERLVNEIYGEQLNNKNLLDDIVKNIKNCCYNLIVIDDIKKSNLNQLKQFANSLPKDSVILLIAIFNLNDDHEKLKTDFDIDDLNKAKERLSELNFNESTIVFTPFNEDDVKNWTLMQIKTDLGMSNVAESDKIIKTVLVDHDVKTDGLKGLHKKIMMELQKIN